MSVFCSHCGTRNDDSAVNCSKCNSPIGHMRPENPYQAGPGPNDVDSSEVPDNKLTWAAVGFVCVLYLVYPSLGIFELIPDALPIVGSLDEAAATTGLWIALTRLNLNPFNKRP